jgi:hypothetical protein
MKVVSITLFRFYSFIMEEHGMFVEKNVEENERNQHERCLRLAIKVRNSSFEFNKYRFF